jgi:hypothetical protein
VTPGAADALLRGIVDYAGMFPPAGLAAGDAVAEYARYRATPDSWIVGTFVIAADRLSELEPTVGPLSVVVTAQSPADLEPVFSAARRTTIAALEFRPGPAGAIAALAAAAPREIQAFFEVPLDDDIGHRLDAIAACGASAKLRAGGLTPDAFPSAPGIYAFLRSCADRGVAAKATAGLHHALAGRYPLTYEPRSPSGAMFGFLGLAAAAALVHAACPREEAIAVLGESSPDAFVFDEDGMAWRGHRVSTDDLRTTRQALFRSFGSCSLREPIDELKRMQIL